MECRERSSPGLKDKLRAHYQKKDEIFQPDPKSANKFGVLFFLYMLLALLGESFYLLLPELFPEPSPWKIFLYVLVFFVFCETVMNWLMSMKHSRVTAGMSGFGKQTAGAGEDSSSRGGAPVTPDGWRNCVKCQLDAPPRSHHCNLCGICVLKRDHHCFFTATCVGFSNQRRFIVLLFYTVVANTVAVVLQCLYLNGQLEIFSWQCLNLIPFISGYHWLVTGQVSFSMLFVIIHLYLTTICLCGAVFFLTWQFIVVSQGQTSHEAWKNITSYRTGVLDGLRSTFGPYGMLHFIFPFQIDLTEDGITWERAIRTKRSN